MHYLDNYISTHSACYHSSLPVELSRAGVQREHTLKGKGDPHGRAGGCRPLLQLPLLEGVMGLCTTLKWSRVVGVVHMMLLPRVHLICLVRILVGGCACMTAAPLQKATDICLP